MIVETKTITLKKSIEFGGQTYAKLALEEPTAGQLEKAGVHDKVLTQQITLIADVARVPPDVVRMIGKRDLEEAAAFLMGFTFVAPTTGDGSSQR